MKDRYLPIASLKFTRCSDNPRCPVTENGHDCGREMIDLTYSQPGAEPLYLCPEMGHDTYWANWYGKLVPICDGCWLPMSDCSCKGR